MPRRSRRRWAAAAAAAACWALLLGVTGSVIAGTALLLLLAALGAGSVLGLRSVGVDAAHPWLRQLAARPWRDGQDVLQLSLRHLADVLVVTPAGSLLAPNCLQLRLSPRDYGTLSELMDIGLVCSSAAEVYEEQVAARGARFAGPGPAEVHVISDPSVPAGRYVLRQGLPPGPGPYAGPPAGFQPPPDASRLVPSRPQPGPWPARPDPGTAFRYARDGHTSAGFVPAGSVSAGSGPAGSVPAGSVSAGSGPAAAGSAGTVITGLPTVLEPVFPPVPLLKLITGDSAAQTRVSGARAGRGAVELVLPEVPTVSREHARFTFADGQWWIANLGRNGLTLNGIPLEAAHVVRDGDSIRWGRNPDAPVSRVVIG
jgi:hypothetical protein